MSQSVSSKAGVCSPDNSDQLIIALEPEAAAIFCGERKMRDFADEKGDANVSDVFARTGSRYVMMDIGGEFFFFDCSLKNLGR